MTREKFGGACHVCERPYTKFRWKAGTGGRFKNTVLCQLCSKLKNVCQVCMLDLQYGSYKFRRNEGGGLSLSLHLDWIISIVAPIWHQKGIHLRRIANAWGISRCSYHLRPPLLSLSLRDRAIRPLS